MADTNKIAAVDAPIVTIAPILPWQDPVAPLALPERRPAAPAVAVAPILPWEVQAAVPQVELAYRPVVVYSEGEPATPSSAGPAESSRKWPPERRPGRRRPPAWQWPREKYWFQCLLYPLLAWKHCIGFALVLTVATAWLFAMLPRTDLFTDGMTSFTPFLFVPILAFAYGCAFLQCVLTSACAGEAPRVYWPGYHIASALKLAGRWVFCFLAGPSALTAVAIVYWVHCGELDAIDMTILCELLVVGVGYWLFALLAATRSDRLWDANPVRVLELARRLGWRGPVIVALAAALVFQMGRMILSGIEQLQREPLEGWMMLVFSWFCAFAAVACLFRMIGLWCHRALEATSRE